MSNGAPFRPARSNRLGPPSPQRDRHDVAGDTTRPRHPLRRSGDLRGAETAARELGSLSLDNALKLACCSPSATRHDSSRRPPLRFIAERLPSIAEVALAAAALVEFRHGDRGVGVTCLERLAGRAPPVA